MLKFIFTRNYALEGMVNNELCLFRFSPIRLLPFKNLDGIGPVDNTASTDYLHHFVKKLNKNKNVTCDM